MATPMLEQYFALKKKHSDTLLLFRLGDFYEGFDEDAKKLSKVLGLTLTHRGEGENRLPMAGIPYHALKNYLPKLIKAGIKVAIADQLEEPKPGQLVKRDVTKIVTAGTIMDENELDPDKNNYIASIYLIKKKGFEIWGLAYADITTSEFKAIDYIQRTNNIPPSELVMDLFRIDPKEILLPSSIFNEIKKLFPNFIYQKIDDRSYFINDLKKDLLVHLDSTSFKSHGLEDLESSLISAGKLLEYLKSNRLDRMSKLMPLKRANNDDHMYLDESTIRNLELLYPLRGSDDRRTLYSVINECRTPMGQRLLRSFVIRPLIKKHLIEKRQDCVSIIYDDNDLNNDITKYLSEISDLERIISKITGKSANARDLLFLSSSVSSALSLINRIQTTKLIEKIDHILPNDILGILKSDVVDLINTSIKEDPAVNITEGDIINKGYDLELDKLRSEVESGKNNIKNFEQKEIKRTGISSLKVRYNSVFGYYIEITRSNLDKAPKEYIRKQTLVNAERYITEELKVWEDKILNGSQLINDMEYKIFEEIRKKIVAQYQNILELSQLISHIDVYNNFASIAKKRSYIKPSILDIDQDTLVLNSRHPVVEVFIPESFIPNDISFKINDSELIILTGPNMAGKSTYIRQVALIFLLAQIGSFIPASKASMCITDRIFTRVGASDDLAGGESTFMVEMLETANILNNATNRSLLILDEVGRGTSTYDGLAIAWSIIEYIVNNIKTRTLFATHYHDLLIMEDLFNTVKNYNIEVKESEGDVLFLHKIVKGGLDKSYGIHVAKLAGLPSKVISRALKVQEQLQTKSIRSYIEKHKLVEDTQIGLITDPIEKVNDDIKNVFNELKDKDINSLSPIEALNFLNKLKGDIENIDNTDNKEK